MEKIRSIWLKAMGGLATFAGGMIFVCVFVQVINTICRKCFGFAILWCDEVSQYCAVEGWLLATPYLVMQSKELSVGVINSVVKNETVLKVIRIVWWVMELALFFVMAKYCLTVAATMKASGIRLNTVPIKKYVLYYIAEVSFVLDFISLLSAPILNRGGFYSD